MWVGIDGDTCDGGLWQTGIDMTYNHGAMTYDGKLFVYFSACKKSLLSPALAWYEWYPDVPYNFNDITIRAGDTIRLTITADSYTSGRAVIENLTNGHTASHYATSTYALCGQTTEWIVEDPSQVDPYGDVTTEPLCNFGTVTFSECSARTSSGRTVSPYGAVINDIQQGGPVLTSTKLHSNVVTISHIG